MAISNLPVQLTSFIGRQDELRAVEQLLSTSRLVTLTGLGGSGKTRLALQIVPKINSLYGDGIWLVELASVHEPALIPQLVGQTLGIRPVPDQPPLESLQNFISTKQLLIILDNCEQLADACAELILQLLSQSPNLRILATSRLVTYLPRSQERQSTVSTWWISSAAAAAMALSFKEGWRPDSQAHPQVPT